MKNADILALRDSANSPINSRAKAREAMQALKAQRKLQRTAAAKPKTNKLKERCSLIIKTALNQFLDRGYEAVSLASIIKESGGSLSTIYECFGSKEGLFKAAIISVINEFSATLEERINGLSCEDLSEFLFQFATEYLQLGRCERITKLSRIAASQTLSANNSICTIFYTTARERIHLVLAKYLTAEHFCSQLKWEHCELLAEQFCMLVGWPFAIKNIYCGEIIEMSDEELANYAKRCVELFLHGALK